MSAVTCSLDHDRPAPSAAMYASGWYLRGPRSYHVCAEHEALVASWPGVTLRGWYQCTVTVQPAGESPADCGLEMPCPAHGGEASQLVSAVAARAEQ